MTLKKRTSPATRRRTKGTAKRNPKHLKKPELKWMDRFLRSLNKVASVETIPALYLPMLRKSAKGISKTFH